MKKLIAIIFAMSFAAQFCLAETILFKSGKTVTAPIVERTEKYIRIDMEGVLLKYYLSEIESIDNVFIQSGREDNHNRPLTMAREKTPEEIFDLCSPAVVAIKTDVGSGSGFIIDDSGIVITNFHVVALASNIQIWVSKPKGAYNPSSVLAYDIVKDICILKFEPENTLATIPLGNDDTVKIGATVFTIGNPLGQSLTFSDGIISQKKENILRNYIQFTSPISSGSSGGPILNLRGEVIGIASEASTTDEYSVTQNLNSAIAIGEADELLKHGKEINMDTFFDRMKTYRTFILARFHAANHEERKNLLEQALRELRDVNEKDSFSVVFYYLYQTNGEIMQYINPIVEHFLEIRNIDDPGPYLEGGFVGSRNNIEFIEILGGVGELIKSYKKNFNPSEDTLKKVISDIFLYPYEAGVISFALCGEISAAKLFYQTYEKYTPFPESLSTLRHYIDQGRKVKGN